MPIYEYYCPHCSKRFETMRAMAQADMPGECPRCAYHDANRVISTIAAISRSGTGSQMSAGSQGGGCGTCGGGHCSTCRH
jgi:putative FmdB family regulatory protein